MEDINEKDYLEEINISEIIEILKKRKKLIVIITILFALISGIISFYLITPKFKTQASLFVSKEKWNIGESITEIDTYSAIISTYAEIIKTKPIISEALNRENIDISAEKVLDNLNVTARGDTQIMDVQYIDEEPDRAFKVINALVNKFLIKSKEMMPNANLQILEPAEEVYTPFSPNKGLYILIGTIVGLITSVVIAFSLEFLNNTYMNEENIQKDLGIPVLGEISLDTRFNRFIKKNNIKKRRYTNAYSRK